MSSKATGILSYFGIVLWLVAFLAGDKEGAKFHLNQSLILTLIMLVFSVVGSLVALIPFVGWLVDCVFLIAWFVFWIMGLISAIQEEEKPLPLIGGLKILK